MANSDSPSTRYGVPRTELFWLAAAVIFGAILRLGFPSRMAIEHFDEGVYASNFWFDAQDDYSYPARYLYAPPLLPAAIEWTMTIASLCGIKPTGFIPIIPCLIAGIAMIPSMWWVCRQWFGPTAALCSAWLVSASDFHASYSRAALTDVPVCLFILWAVYFIGRALLKCAADGIPGSRPQKRKAQTQVPLPWQEILAASLFTGLAWWTKYNGWLPLAIGITAAVVWQFLTPPAERKISRVLTCWCLIAVFSCLIWSPVLWGLQKHGGYATVAANHKQYIVGFGGWGKTAILQMFNIGFYESPFEVFDFSLHDQNVRPQDCIPQQRWWWFTTLSSGSTYSDLFQFGNWLSMVKFIQTSGLLVVLPLLVVLSLLISSLSVCALQLKHVRAQEPSIAVSLVVSWIAGLTVATPFYYPYPRLVLPWLCATWICLGLAVRLWTERRKSGTTGSAATIPHCISKMLIIGLVGVALIKLWTGTGHVWSDRTTVQHMSQDFADLIKRQTAVAGFPESEAIVYTIAQPALVFGLKAEGLPMVAPVQGLDFFNDPILRPTFVAVPSRDSAMSPEDRGRLSTLYFEQTRSDVTAPSHLVILDDPGIQLWPDDQTILIRLKK